MENRLDKISLFLKKSKVELFQHTPNSLKHLQLGFMDSFVVPVLKEYKKILKEQRLPAEEHLKNHLYSKAFSDFRCFLSMVKLMEEWVKL